MRASGTLEQRLSAHVQPVIRMKEGEARFYAIVEPPDLVIVEERALPGEARIECRLPAGVRCVVWNLGTGMFRFLQQEKNADGALLVWRSDGSEDGHFEAHVLECKRTVDQSKWAEVLQQMRWTLARLLAIAGTLGIPLRRARFYTAFRRDNLSSDSSRNPVLPRVPIGDDPSQPDAVELSRPRRQQLDWQNDELSMDGFDGRHPHWKVQLDEATGAGAVDLFDH